MSNTEIFNCKACSKSFASKKGLNQHSSIHSSDGPAFQCEFCSKTFKYKSNLYEHLSVHTVSEPYSCPYCDKKTRYTPGKFQKHLATHFTDKSLLDEVWAPYASHKKYEKCGNRRSEVPKQKEHQSTVPQNVFHQPSNFHLYQNFHDPCINTIGKLIDSVKSIELERYHCSICCYEFARKADCIFHYQYFHPNLQMELFCHICLRTFPNQEEFQKHVEYHRTTSRVLQNSRTITSPKFYIPTGEEILTALNSGWHQQPATYF